MIIIKVIGIVLLTIILTIFIYKISVNDDRFNSVEELPTNEIDPSFSIQNNSTSKDETNLNKEDDGMLDIYRFLNKSYRIKIQKLIYKYNNIVKDKLKNFTEIFYDSKLSSLEVNTVKNGEYIISYVLYKEYIIIMNDNKYEVDCLINSFISKNYKSIFIDSTNICKKLNEVDKCLESLQVLKEKIKNQKFNYIRIFDIACKIYKDIKYKGIFVSEIYYKKDTEFINFYVKYNDEYIPVQYNLKICNDVSYEIFLKSIDLRLLEENENLIAYVSEIFKNISIFDKDINQKETLTRLRNPFNIQYNISENIVEDSSTGSSVENITEEEEFSKIKKPLRAEYIIKEDNASSSSAKNIIDSAEVKKNDVLSNSYKKEETPDFKDIEPRSFDDGRIYDQVCDDINEYDDQEISNNESYLILNKECIYDTIDEPIYARVKKRSREEKRNNVLERNLEPIYDNPLERGRNEMYDNVLERNLEPIYDNPLENIQSTYKMRYLPDQALQSTSLNCKDYNEKHSFSAESYELRNNTSDIFPLNGINIKAISIPGQYVNLVYQEIKIRIPRSINEIFRIYMFHEIISALELTFFDLRTGNTPNIF